MKRYAFSLLMLLSCGTLVAQARPEVPADTTRLDAQVKAWLANLYEVGVEARGDSVYISEEARRAAIDPGFRQAVYPSAYTLEGARAALQARYVKIAVWHMINAYLADAALQGAVTEALIAMDKAIAMDRVLIAAFYTYGMFDPAVGTLKDGRPEITHPEVLESKLRAVRVLTDEVLAARETRKQG